MPTNRSTPTATPKTDTLLSLLAQRFDYTQDNNRDVVMDPTFGLAEATEEILARAAYEYLTAYLVRDPNESYFEED